MNWCTNTYEQFGTLLLIFLAFLVCTYIASCPYYNIKIKSSPHFGTLQYSHLVLGSIVKHHGPSGPLDPGLRQ